MDEKSSNFFMLTELKTSLDSLRGGKAFFFDEELDSAILDLQEEGVGFDPVIMAHGEAYLAADELIIHFDASITAYLPCKICNQMTPILLEIKNGYHTEDVSNLGSIVDIGEAIREDLLLTLPEQMECNNNHCPHREEIAKYLTQEKDPEKRATKNPFSKISKKNSKQHK